MVLFSGFAVLVYHTTSLQTSVERPAHYVEVGFLGARRGAYPSARTLELQGWELKSTAEKRWHGGRAPSLLLHRSSHKSVFTVISVASGSQMNTAGGFYTDEPKYLSAENCT